ncbi:MAG: ABC transporter ATP-binding protein [Bacteroidetes bacterium]|nr:ABC transporter ATP-binding protein [Bacteroidota bacterium]
MSNKVISVENISKQYRLGSIGRASLSDEFKSFVNRISGKKESVQIDENDRTIKGTSNLVWALKDVSFDVSQGEVVGIIGKNGAGKSTLLKILSRTTTPTTGTIKLKGRVASLLEVGTGFHPELSGRENIFLNGTIMGMTKREVAQKFDEIVDFAGVEKYIDTPVKRYSSGMYVRLAFAVAAHLEPEILIVDEVLAVGDVEFQKKCLGKMKDVSSAGRTVLFVSHNMPVLKALCTRSIMLEKGKIIKNGNTNEIVSYYLNSEKAATDKDGVIPVSTQRIGTGEGKFFYFALLDEQTKSGTDQIYFRDTLVVKLGFEAFKTIPKINFWMRIFNSDGMEVALIEQSKDMFFADKVSEGKHTYEIDMHIDLLPGSYHMSVGTYANGSAFDYIDKVIEFTVLQTSRNTTEHYRWDKSFGSVMVESNWKKLN